MTKKKTIRIAAYDPGLSRTAVAIGDFDPTTNVVTLTKTHMYRAAQIVARKPYRDLVEKFGKRMATLTLLETEFARQLDLWQPDYIVAEGLFYNPRRPTAFLALAQWTTIIERTAMQRGQRVYVIPTRTAKQCVTGDGGCDKPTVQETLLSLPYLKIGMKGDIMALSNDESDAIAILYTFSRLTLPTLLDTADQ